MRTVVLLIALVGCKADVGDYPITIGGDDHPINPMVDGRPADGVVGDGSMLNGRVCVVTDLRTPTTGCAVTGAANITVTLGSETTMTADDGSFMLMPPSGSGLVWHASGTNLVTSVIPLSTVNILPMISDIDYLALQNSNSVVLNSGEGSAFVYVRQGGVELADATTTVKAPDIATYATLGDTASSAINWVQGATGPLGVAWTPGLLAGTRTLLVTPPLGSQAMLPLPIEDGAITFATLVIP